MTVSADIERIFTYQAPKPEHVQAMKAIRARACELAQTIVDQCPPSADRTAAIRKLREAVMTANASVVLEGKEVSAQVRTGVPLHCSCPNRMGSKIKCVELQLLRGNVTGGPSNPDSCKCPCHEGVA